MKRRWRRKLGAPEALEGVIARAGEDRFAKQREPIPNPLWVRAVGGRIADRTRPLELDRGVLTVRVATATWSTELSLLEVTIVERLRQSGLDITKLRFRVGTIEAPARPPERRITRTVPKPVPLPVHLVGSLEEVEDEELRSAVAKAASANLAWQANARPEAPVPIHPRAKLPR